MSDGHSDFGGQSQHFPKRDMQLETGDQLLGPKAERLS